MQNDPREHSAMLSTFIKLPFVFKTFVLFILNGRLRQVLLYTIADDTVEVSQVLPFGAWSSGFSFDLYVLLFMDIQPTG